MKTTKLGSYAFAAMGISFGGIAAIAACSAQRSVGSDEWGGSGGAPSSASTSSSGGSAGAGFANSSSSSWNPDSGACAGTSSKAMLLPLDILLMLDRSDSMFLENVVNSNVEKWDAATMAINQFVSSPKAAGIGLGFSYFPVPRSEECVAEFAAGQTTLDCQTDGDCTAACGPCDTSNSLCTGGYDSCTSADYQSLLVPIAALPGNAALVAAALASNDWGGDTPMAPALQGVIDAALAWQANHPTHKTVVVFATDGLPSECAGFDAGTSATIGSPSDPPATYKDEQTHTAQSICAVAAYGFAQDMFTYVIGIVGPSVPLSALDAVAAAGGTGKAFFVNQADAVDQLVNALDTVRGSLQCTYDIPKTPSGQTPDFSLINVDYTPGDGGAKQTIPQVPNQAACGNGEGWYYNNDVHPSQIITCSATCDKFVADTKGEVDVVIGCQTVVK